jgi:hypothetical protein
VTAPATIPRTMWLAIISPLGYAPWNSCYNCDTPVIPYDYAPPAKSDLNLRRVTKLCSRLRSCSVVDRTRFPLLAKTPGAAACQIASWN